MNMEWIEGFIIFSLILWCARNELFIRQINKGKVPELWKEIGILHKNDSTNHNILGADKVTYDWKEEEDAVPNPYYMSGVGGTSGSLDPSGCSNWQSSPVPGKPGRVYRRDYIPMNKLLDLILEHIEIKPVKLPLEEPKLFGLKKVEPQ